MKKFNIIAIVIAIVLTLAGCKKYEPRFEGAYKDSVGKMRVVYVDNANSIIFTDRYFQRRKKLTTETKPIIRLSLSRDFSKVACQFSDYSIKIVDTSGTVLANNLGNGSRITYFEWTKGGQLYSLAGVNTRAITSLYGGALPPISPNLHFTSSNSAITLSFIYIFNNNDVFLCETDQYGNNHYRYIKQDGTLVKNIEQGRASNISDFRYIEGEDQGMSMSVPLANAQRNAHYVFQKFNNPTQLTTQSLVGNAFYQLYDYKQSQGFLRVRTDLSDGNNVISITNPSKYSPEYSVEVEVIRGISKPCIVDMK
jgi:hypothetical protein